MHPGDHLKTLLAVVSLASPWIIPWLETIGKVEAVVIPAAAFILILFQIRYYHRRTK